MHLRLEILSKFSKNSTNLFILNSRIGKIFSKKFLRIFKNLADIFWKFFLHILISFTFQKILSYFYHNLIKIL